VDALVTPIAGAPASASSSSSGEASTAAPDDDGVDVSLIRWMLSLTPEQRLDALQGFVDSALALMNAPRR
jgi:hypothetical protein